MMNEEDLDEVIESLEWDIKQRTHFYLIDESEIAVVLRQHAEHLLTLARILKEGLRAPLN